MSDNFVPPNLDALERTLAELKREGRLAKTDAAHIQAVRSMALALDYDPSNASLWRQYREAIKELTASESSSLDSEIARLFADSDAEMGDPPTS